MAVTNGFIKAQELAQLTGKTFTLEGVGTKTVTLVPSAGPKGAAVGHKIILSKGTIIEGFPMKTVVAGKTVGAGKAAAMGGAAATGKTMAVAKAVAATAPLGLVEIEGAGTVVGAGKNLSLKGLEITGVLQKGTHGTQVLFTGGEASVTQGTAAAAADMKTKAAVAKGAGTVAKVTAPAVAGASSIAPVAKAAATTGTIWNGGGLSLGLGLGLGAWGPVLLLGTVAAVGVGVYGYLKNKNQISGT